MFTLALEDLAAYPEPRWVVRYFGRYILSFESKEEASEYCANQGERHAIHR
jgi:hypothetical protein